MCNLLYDVLLVVTKQYVIHNQPSAFVNYNLYTKVQSVLEDLEREYTRDEDLCGGGNSDRTSPPRQRRRHRQAHQPPPGPEGEFSPGLHDGETERGELPQVPQEVQCLLGPPGNKHGRQDARSWRLRQKWVHLWFGFDLILLWRMWKLTACFNRPPEEYQL